MANTLSTKTNRDKYRSNQIEQALRNALVAEATPAQRVRLKRELSHTSAAGKIQGQGQLGEGAMYGATYRGVYQILRYCWAIVYRLNEVKTSILQ